MKKIIINLSTIVLFFLIITKHTIITDAIIYGINLWVGQLFPSIFPILLISDLIISTNILETISNIIGPLFKYLFKVSKYGAYVFIMSVISGCPSNAKYIRDLLDNKLINEKEASKILAMSLLYNPLLIITITSFLNIKDAILIISFNILTNLFIGLINRNYNAPSQDLPYIKRKYNLVDSISKSINTLLLILGTIVTFSALSSLLPIQHPLLTGILEITKGFNEINLYPFKYEYQMIFSAILLSFGGFSIHLQIKSILNKYDLDYSLFYKSRILHLVFFYLIVKLYALVTAI